MLFEPRKGRVHRAPGESLRTIQTDASAEDNLSDVDIIMTVLVSVEFRLFIMPARLRGNGYGFRLKTWLHRIKSFLP